MIKESIVFDVNKETLAGIILAKNDTTIPPKCVFMHGGGSGVKERVCGIAEPIINHNINILAFDFSGHGESTGELKKGNLKKRVKEAKNAIQLFASHKPLILCGASMGGYVAIKLLEYVKVDTLILICPALYDKAAYEVQFDAGFTDIIRESQSWRNTDVLDLLKSFTGKLLIVIGDKDEVIPQDVIDLIIANSQKAKKKELYIIPEGPHRIIKWLMDKPEELQRFHKKIEEFV